MILVLGTPAIKVTWVRLHKFYSKLQKIESNVIAIFLQKSDGFKLLCGKLLRKVLMIVLRHHIGEQMINIDSQSGFEDKYCLYWSKYDFFEKKLEIYFWTSKLRRSNLIYVA